MLQGITDRSNGKAMTSNSLLGICFLPAVVAWGAGVVFMFRVARHAQRLIAPPWYINWNPLNLLFRPDLWTPEAERDCMAVLVSLGLFLALGLAGLLCMAAIALVS